MSLADVLAVPELCRRVLAFAVEGMRAQSLSWNVTPFDIFDIPDDYDPEFQKLEAISCGPEMWRPLAPLRRLHNLECSFGVWRAGPSIYVNAGNEQPSLSDRDEDYAEDERESLEVVQVGDCLLGRRSRGI